MDHEQFKMEYKRKMEVLTEDAELKKAWMRIKKIRVSDIRKMLERYGLNTVGEKSVLQERVYRFQARLLRPAADVPWMKDVDEIEGVAVNTREGWLDINPTVEELLKKGRRRSGSGTATSGRETLFSDQGAVGGRRPSRMTADSGSEAHRDMDLTMRRRTSNVSMPTKYTRVAEQMAATTRVRLGAESPRAEILNQNIQTGSRSQDETTHRSTGTRKKSLPLELSLQRVRLTDVETRRTHSSPIESGQPTSGTKRTLVPVQPIDMTRSNVPSPVMHTIVESDIESDESSDEEIRQKRQRRMKRIDKRPTASKVGGGGETNIKSKQQLFEWIGVGKSRRANDSANEYDVQEN